METTTSTESKRTRWYQKMNPFCWGATPKIPNSRTLSRESIAGFFSRLTFQWVTPIVATGYKRQLESVDIWSVHPNRAVEPLTNKVKQHFHRYVSNGQKHALLWALYRTFRFEFWLGALCALLSSILRVASAFTLRFLIQFAMAAYKANALDRPPPAVGNGIGIVLGITVMTILQSIGINHYLYCGQMVGSQSRGVLISMIYDKSMVISGRAKAGCSNEVGMMRKVSEGGQKKNGETLPRKRHAEDRLGWTNGQILGLMNVDAARINRALAVFHATWTCPIACIIALVTLFVNLHYGALPGFGLLVFGIPTLTVAVRSLLRRRKKINLFTALRANLTQEVLQSIRFIKTFAWERAFIGRLGELRLQELLAIQSLLSIRNCITVVSASLPTIASMVSFITFFLCGNSLSPARVFSALAIFNSLRVPLNQMAVAIGHATDAWLSLKRIEKFLLEEEEQDENVLQPPDSGSAVELRDASFTWEVARAPNKARGTRNPASRSKLEEDTLASISVENDSVKAAFELLDISLNVRPGELIAVIGTVGSGKSSLLAALAGSMRKTSGDVAINSSRAICPEIPWIQSTTLQKNITFGSELDNGWYEDVINACALQVDIDELPDGSQTEIGEGGLTLSGGQKQRINLARAIYSNADVLLLDDPLSSVDVHVGQYIFNNAILGLLKDKCCILATQQLWAIKQCDRIIWMRQGKVQAFDTFGSLSRDNSDFSVLMHSTSADQSRGKQDTARATPRDKQKREMSQTKLISRNGFGRGKDCVSRITWKGFAYYVRASGSMLNAFLVIVVLLLSRGSSLMVGLWVSYWTSDKFNVSSAQYIGIYAGLGTSQVILALFFSILVSVLCTRASRVIFLDTLTRILLAPLSFFDVTPQRQVMDCLSHDVEVVDNSLGGALRMFLVTITTIVSTLAFITAFFYFFILALIPLSLFLMSAVLYYHALATKLRSFRFAMKSSLYSKMREDLRGIGSIQAYGLRQLFINNQRDLVDDMNSIEYLDTASQRWLSMRLDIVGNALVFTVGILVITSRFTVDPSVTGLVLSYILAIVQLLQLSAHQFTVVNDNTKSIQALHNYSTQEAEGPWHTNNIRHSWPEEGEVVFDNVQVRYREDLPLILRNISVHIRPGEHVGIVGRTGAGKSTVLNSLLRLIEVSQGSILIDGVNIATIGLHDLRSRLTVVPQEPVLFQGTIRSNLDPFGEHRDGDLWHALTQAHMVPNKSEPSEDDNTDQNSPQRIRLDSAVEEGGTNFSIGQRQLIALARAIIRGSQVIVCDEATSSVDTETDVKVQQTLATAFRGKTLVCVAHRLRSVVGYDRICVLDSGQLVEIDTPLELWHREGIFRGMCDQSGISMEEIKGAGVSTA